MEVRRTLRTIEDLRRAGGIVDPLAKRGRGRPRLKSLGEILRSRSGKWAIAVHKEALLTGGRRGSIAAAINKIARKEPGYSPALRKSIEARIKQALKRTPNAKFFAEAEVRELQFWEEILRRTRGFPDDVMKMIGTWDAHGLLAQLRDADVDGTCPDELIAMARTPRR